MTAPLERLSVRDFAELLEQLYRRYVTARRLTAGEVVEWHADLRRWTTADVSVGVAHYARAEEFFPRSPASLARAIRSAQTERQRAEGMRQDEDTAEVWQRSRSRPEVARVWLGVIRDILPERMGGMGKLPGGQSEAYYVAEYRRRGGR